MSKKKLTLYASLVLIGLLIGGPLLALLMILLSVYIHKKQSKTAPKITVTIETKEKAIEQKEFQDKRKAECPYCNKALKKVPGAKTKCPHCGEYMYARTNPDNVRLVFTVTEGEIVSEVEHLSGKLNV